MSRKGKLVRVFPGSNTCLGFYSFYDSLLSGLDRVFVLKGGPGTGKSTLMKRIGLVMADRGFDVELLCCSSDNSSLDGVLIPQVKVGIVDGTAPHVIDPKYPGVVDEIINLGEYWNNEKLAAAKEEIISLCNQKTANYFQVYRSLEQAQHEVIEDNEESLSDEAIKELAARLGEGIFNKPQPQLRHLFSGAITASGPIHYTREILGGYKKKLKLVGGTRNDKSRFLQQVSLLALENGFNADLYHCFFNPVYHTMLLLPGLKVALIENFLPQLGRLLEEEEFTGTAVIGEEKLLVKFNEQAGKHLDKAINQLKLAKQNHEELEKFYVQAMDYEAVDKLREKLLVKILSQANKK